MKQESNAFIIMMAIAKLLDMYLGKILIFVGLLAAFAFGFSAGQRVGEVENMFKNTNITQIGGI